MTVLVLVLESVLTRRGILFCCNWTSSEYNTGTMIMTIKGQNEEFFTTKEAAIYLHVAEDTVRTYCKRNLLQPYGKVGTSLLFTRTECDRYNREKRGPGKPPKKS